MIMICIVIAIIILPRSAVYEAGPEAIIIIIVMIIISSSSIIIISIIIIIIIIISSSRSSCMFIFSSSSSSICMFMIMNCIIIAIIVLPRVAVYEAGAGESNLSDNLRWTVSYGDSTLYVYHYNIIVILLLVLLSLLSFTSLLHYIIISIIKLSLWLYYKCLVYLDKSHGQFSNWASQILKANMLPICPYSLKSQIARV